MNLPPAKRIKSYQEYLDHEGITHADGRYVLLNGDEYLLEPDFVWPTYTLYSVGVENQPLLTSLSGVFVYESLVVENCENLVSLSDLDSVSKLTITNCPKLTSIPQVADNAHYVRVYGCPGLTTLSKVPSAFELRFQHCVNLTQLKGEFKVYNLSIIDCPNFKTIPEEVRPDTALLIDLPNVTHIPIGFAPLHLEIRGTTGVKSIDRLNERVWVTLPDGNRVYAEVFHIGITYRNEKWKVESPNYERLQKLFISIRNVEYRRSLISILGPEHTAKMLDAIEFKRGKVGKENVRILRTRERDRLINSRHYWVEVRCPSTDRMYMLPVPPSRTKSCVDAVAYTFGLTGKEYRPLIET